LTPVCAPKLLSNSPFSLLHISNTTELVEVLKSPSKETSTLSHNNNSNSAHFSDFCGFVKLKVLNLRRFYRSQNLRPHFSTV